MEKKHLENLKSVQEFKKSIGKTHIFIHGLESNIAATEAVLDFTKAKSNPNYNKFKELLDEGGGQKVKVIVPSAYFLAGSALFFLPSVIDAFTETLFGSGYNVLAYSSSNTGDIYGSISMLIQTAGFIWFMRGCVLLAHASHPEQGQEGSKGHGPKGFLFVCSLP